MKASKFVLAALLVVITLTGCPREIDPPEPEPEKPTAYSATLEQMSGAQETSWPQDASIRVFLPDAGAEGRVFPASAISASGTAKFADSGFSAYDAPVFALYPASAHGFLRGEALLVTFPQTRQIGWEPAVGELPMAAYSNEDAEMAFRHLCGIVTVQISSSSALREVRLTSNSDEALWGTATVALQDSQAVPVRMENESADRNTLVITAAGTEASNGNESFVTGSNSTISSGNITPDGAAGTSVCRFAVPAGALKQGFRLTVIDQSGGFMQKEFPAAEIRRAECSAAEGVAYKDASEDIEVRTDVLNKAFYKDLFMDSGIYLTSSREMPAADFLGIQMEYLLAAASNPKPADIEAQWNVFTGTEDDTNGRFLYPDGEPRYKIVYVWGGGSNDHGSTLKSEGRERFRQFVANGGSYMGSCAGAYLVTRGYDLDGESRAFYLGIWPGHCNRLSTQQIYPGHVIPKDSPLLKYYDFGGDFYIDSVRHHNGPCFKDYECVPGTEVLTRFDIPDSTKMHGNPAIVAWKKDKWWGRVLPCGSHPEAIPDGEKLLLTAAMLRYCMDGVGIAKVKGVLHNGDVRRMVRSTEDNAPAYTKIGDRQCHHFVFSLPEGAKNVKVRLESLDKYNLSLHLAKGTFAFKEDAQYKVEGVQSGKQLFFDTLEAGTWYVGVQCESTVTVSDPNGTYGTTYSNTGILNGAPYTIQVSWDY
ncbi:MAG: hypothetical protein J5699_06435 [Bacteroidales bacterium]|nr:hypothetical protein [Bacteroidales bacterium]